MNQYRTGGAGYYAASYGVEVMQTGGFVPPATGDWWLAAASIDAANVLEHVDNPEVGQLYGGGAISPGDPWTIAFKSTSYSEFPVDGNHYAFDTQTGRIIFGNSTNVTYGYYDGTWRSVSIFTDTNIHTWFLTSSGADIQAYRDAVAFGSPSSSTKAIGGVSSRWRSSYNSAATSRWLNTPFYGAVYNIQLNGTQMAALHAAMMALV